MVYGPEGERGVIMDLKACRFSNCRSSKHERGTTYNYLQVPINTEDAVVTNTQRGAPCWRPD